MKTREEYYESVLKNRVLAADPDVTMCTCPNDMCDWHGKCKECVALHRYHNDHVPYCLQGIIDDKIRALAGAAEMNATKKRGTPIEYHHYVRQRDRENDKEE